MIVKSALIAATLALATAAAQAGNVFWSIGINAPLQPGVSIGTVFSNGPAYAPVYAPVYAPAPVVVAPAVYAEPDYYAPAPVFVRPAPRYYRPAPVHMPWQVVYAPRWDAPRHRGSDWRYERPQRGEPVMVR